MALHYGQAIFEGMKAFRQPNGDVALFRPDANIARFNVSAERMYAWWWSSFTRRWWSWSS